MPYAVIMEIQIGLDIVSCRAGKTAAGQVCKQRMGLWREFFPGAEKLQFHLSSTSKYTGYAYSVRRETGRDQGVKVPDH
jgi:hypothetical protein